VTLRFKDNINSTVITNTGEDINYFRKKSEQIFKALLEKQEE